MLTFSIPTSAKPTYFVSSHIYREAVYRIKGTKEKSPPIHTPCLPLVLVVVLVAIQAHHLLQQIHLYDANFDRIMEHWAQEKYSQPFLLRRRRCCNHQEKKKLFLLKLRILLTKSDSKHFSFSLLRARSGTNDRTFTANLFTARYGTTGK